MSVENNIKNATHNFKSKMQAEIQNSSVDVDSKELFKKFVDEMANLVDKIAHKVRHVD